MDSRITGENKNSKVLNHRILEFALCAREEAIKMRDAIRAAVKQA